MYFEDRQVLEGETYLYRLLVDGPSGSTIASMTTVLVPMRPQLALVVTPNPVQSRARVTFHLALQSAAALEVWDVAGRRVWSANVGDLDPGSFHSSFPGEPSAPARVRVIRLGQAGQAVTRRFAVVR
jgi:hypothetical protein